MSAAAAAAAAPPVTILCVDDEPNILAADHVLNDRLLKQLADFERRSGTTLQLFIKTGAS